MALGLGKKQKAEKEYFLDLVKKREKSLQRKMLSKKNRLKKVRDFERVFQKGKGFKKGFFYVKIVSNGLEKSRFGIIVSKKAFRKAVVRNRIKRKIREFLRKDLEKIKKGLDCAIVFLGNNDINIKDIDSGLASVFKKANFYENNTNNDKKNNS